MIGNFEAVRYGSGMTEANEVGRPPLAWMWWIPAVVWAAGIFYLSSKQAKDLPQIDIPYLDKVVHFILYGTLSTLTFCGLRLGSARNFRVAMFLGLLIASLYGVSDEYHQRFVSGRSCDVFDWVADTLGGSVVFLAAFLRPKGPPPV